MTKVSATIKKELYKTEITSPSGNVVISDEPVDKGGMNKGFSPHELLVAALSACTSATLRMYADRKGWDVQEVHVETELMDVDNTSLFTRKIKFTGTLDEDQKKRLLEIANKCPIHKVLSGPIKIETGLGD